MNPKDLVLTPPGQTSGPSSLRFPRVLGGQCEICGTLDKNVDGKYQYKLCPHFKDMKLKCVFCKESADHDEVVRQSQMLVMQDPQFPKQLLTLCGSYECSRKFEAKYGIQPN